MKKSLNQKNKGIPSFILDKNYFFIHKKGPVNSKFGLDDTNELIESGFGLYSSTKGWEKIGPLRSNFFRIGFCRKGSLQVDCGLETFTHQRDTIHFTFPGQLFALRNKSPDMHCHYILFSQAFIEEVLPAAKIQHLYPFLDYTGVPFIKLSEEEAKRMEELIFNIDSEIKTNHSDKGRAIKLLLNLILVTANRSYNRQGLITVNHNQKTMPLVVRYKKLVAQHFRRMRSVNEYASELAVSPKHLSKIIKQETGKKAHDFIDEMLIMELMALLKYSLLNISEIAYHLDFTDPSHLTKFFKKHAGITPQQFRNQSP